VKGNASTLQEKGWFVWLVVGFLFCFVLIIYPNKHWALFSFFFFFFFFFKLRGYHFISCLSHGNPVSGLFQIKVGKCQA
jgi:multisubunit Na+/H+ antiporter MnhB subunit